MKKITFAALAVPLMWVLLLLLLFNSNKLHAQENMVLSGVVKNADGTPLEGVTVWQKDTDNGTQTTEQGFYSLEISPNAEIVFEYVGFKTHTVRVTGKVLNVTLTADDDLLDEVVINAGYYSVKDKERTGSISKITSKEIGQQPVANPLAAMQGRMAGVNITQSSGTPGGGFDIQIRGRNSLRTEGNAPLYIVDGVPYASQSVSDAQLSAGILVGNVSPLNSINPNDIESIEVLKDADATAIYGSRGSNGVVLITTKKGSSDKTTFSVQSTTSVSTVSKFMDFMSTEEYVKMRRDAYANDGITAYPANAHDVNGTWGENRYTDWQKEFLGGKAVSQNMQFSVSGGAGQTSYLLGAGHRKDETVFPGDFGYKRTNFILNLSHRSKDDKFSLQAGVQTSAQKNRLMASDLARQVFLAPNAPALYDEKGNLNWENNTFDNPLSKLNSQYGSQTDEFLAQITSSYRLAANLNFNISGGITNSQYNEFKTIPHTIYNPSYGLTSTNSSITVSDYDKKSWIVEPKLTWNSQGEESSWDVLAGATLEERTMQSFSLTASNFTSDAFIRNISNAATRKINRDSEGMYRYAALFARINYKYLDRYIVNLTGRRDGSSRFGANNRFANFGAVGAAWLFGREKVFDNSTWLNFGKLRASYGITGSDLIGDYQYLDSFGITGISYDGTVGMDPLRLYNPDFSWETNRKLEVAAEFEFFKGRVAPSVSYHLNRSSNQLVGIPLPATTGFASVQGNLAATVENSGWEFTLHTLNIDKGAFRWNTNFNLSIPKNRLVAFPNLEESTYANQYKVGQSVNVRKVYQYMGVNPQTGLYEVKDTDNDGKITIEDKNSYVNIGVIYAGGLANSFTYRNWELDFLLQFVKQNNYTPDYTRTILGSSANAFKRAADYYTAENTSAVYQKPTTGADAAAVEAFKNYMESNGVIDDASFIRLKSLQLKYSFSGLFSSNTRVSIAVQGYNLLTFTRFWGSDPEAVGGYLPAPRTWAFSVNLNF